MNYFRTISQTDIERGNVHLMKFCTQIQDKYGPGFIRPNMHIHMHIAEDRRKFGPAPATWQVLQH